MILQPTSYSRCKTIEQYKKALTVYSQQISNSPEAVDGKVFELADETGRCIGSLGDCYKQLKRKTVYVHAYDGLLVIERLPNGDWIVTE